MAGAEIPVRAYVRRVPSALRPTLQAGRATIKALAPKGTKDAARPGLKRLIRNAFGTDMRGRTA